MYVGPCRNLVKKAIAPITYRKVTTLRDKVCQLQEALLDPTYPKAYIKQRLRCDYLWFLPDPNVGTPGHP